MILMDIKRFLNIITQMCFSTSWWGADLQNFEFIKFVENITNKFRIVMNFQMIIFSIRLKRSIKNICFRIVGLVVAIKVMNKI